MGGGESVRMRKGMNENASENKRNNEARTKETPENALHKICIYMQAYVPHKSVYESAFMSLLFLLHRLFLCKDAHENKREMEREEVSEQ